MIIHRIFQPMAKLIEINVPVEEIEARRSRVEAARRFEEPDRVPVLPAIAHRHLIPRVGTKFTAKQP